MDSLAKGDRWIRIQRPPEKWQPATICSEETRLTLGQFFAEIFVGAGRGHAAALGAVNQPNLHEVGLVDFFDSIFFFGEGGGERAEAYRSPGILIEKRKHQVTVDFVKTAFVYAEHSQGFLRDGSSDAACGTHFGKITGAAEETVGDARCAAAATGDFFGAAIVHQNI